MTTIRKLIRLRKQVDDLHFDVNRGAYAKEHLQRLQDLIERVASSCRIETKQISQFSGVTPAVIRSIRGGGYPKLHNFLGTCSGLSLIVTQRLVELGALVRIDPLDFDGSMWLRPEKFTTRGELLSLAESLDRFCETYRAQNDLGAVLTETDRKDLIDLLQTAIKQLKGPLLELGMFRGVGKRLRGILTATAKEAGKELLKDGAKRAIESLDKVF